MKPLTDWLPFGSRRRVTREPDPARPPTILSDYGEGYCRHCQFVVGLTQQGTLAPHVRGTAVYDRKPCKGSYTRPPSRTPYYSRKAAFTVRVPKATCPHCKIPVDVKIIGGTPTYARHSRPGTLYPAARPATLCSLSGRAVQKDQNNSRG